MKMGHIIPVLGIAVLALTMGGCGDDDPDSDDGNTDTATGYLVRYLAEFQEDELTLFNVTVSYKKADGTTDAAPIINATWNSEELTVSKDILPFTAEMWLTYTKKADYPQKDIYTVGRGYVIQYKPDKPADSIWLGSANLNKTSLPLNDRFEEQRDSIINNSKNYTCEQEIPPTVN
jgi:hypothetical protein